MATDIDLPVVVQDEEIEMKENEQPTEKGKKVKLKKADELGRFIEDKGFPSKPGDIITMQIRSKTGKRRLQLKPMEILSLARMTNGRRKSNGNKNMDMEELSKYLILQNSCDIVKKKKKKKTKKVCKNGVGYSLEVTEELAFLLGTMADAREHMVQKAIENKWREEEEEKKAKEAGDIHGLMKIVEGMMIKFIKIEEERQALLEKKQKEGLEKERKHSKGKRDSKNDSIGSEEAQPTQTHTRPIPNNELTKDLVGFLKTMLDADLKRKETKFVEKTTSINEDDISAESIDVIETLEEAKLEEEQEAEEKAADGEGEEAEIGEGEENIQDENLVVEEIEGFVDMNEVNKKLEEFIHTEGEENNQEEMEEEEEIKAWQKSLLSPRPSPKQTAEATTQFDYFLERKLALGMDKEPKDVTEDLTLFLKTMMMADPTTREIIKEKELKDYWKKIENFDSWGNGSQTKTEEKCGKRCCEKSIKDTKQVKCKNAFKCAHKKPLKKTKGKARKSVDKNNGDGIELENGYCLMPKEFLMLLQGVHNTLTIAQEIDEEKKRLAEAADVVEEAEEDLNQSILVALTDYINEPESNMEGEERWEDEENRNNEET